MKIKVGINGMGRIGRMIVRSIVENKYSNFEIKHINNRTNTETCSNLLKFDSIHGRFNAEVKFDQNNLMVNKNKITFSQEMDINKINWEKFGVDYVFECTGKFNSKDKLMPHLKNGAEIDDIVINANVSDVGFKRSFGIMVNYKYELGKIEQNHQEYVNEKKINISSKLKKYV